MSQKSVHVSGTLSTQPLANLHFWVVFYIDQLLVLLFSTWKTLPSCELQLVHLLTTSDVSHVRASSDIITTVYQH